MTKKIVVLLLIAVMLFSIVSCKKEEDPAEVSLSSGIGRYSDEDETTLHFPVKYIHTYRTEMGVDYPVVVEISSRADLLNYCVENQNIYNFEQSWYSVSFYDAITEYDEEFFSTRSLLLVLIYAPSESYTHSLKQISKTDSGYSIDVIRFVPEAATDVEALWHLIVEVPKDSAVLADVNAVHVSIEEKAK
ncbi:MAG: hypothetical protein IKV39_03875 [Clostridia bacterium]|nr:hypothetical protein [Clostridia bacterium]